uniref:ComEC/Rec2 family competence protein n=1 Tax=Anaerolinea sp. TaxID=1872519 RepID=UPI002ACD720B
EAPVTRAALMSALALTAHAIRRSTGGLNALLFATAGMTLFNPFLPWDVGFQLSFSATLGLLLYASRLDGWARRITARFLPVRVAGAVAGALGEYILFTLAAQAATLPVILSHFGRLALSTLLANPLILPAQAPLLLFGEASLALGAVWQPLGHLLALPAWALASYTLEVVAWMARLPLGAWAVPAPPLWVVILFYLWFSATALRAMGLPRLDTSLRPTWLLLGLFGIAAVLWRQVLAGGDGKLHLWVSVQQDSVLTMVQTPGGETLLINGLGQARESQAFLGKVLPPFNPPLAWWILASPSAAEVQGGLGALARFAVRQAALCGGLPSDRTTRTLEERLAAAGTPWQEWTDGAMLRQGRFSLQARMPNAETCLLILQEGQLKLILAGNASPQELPDLSDFMNGVIVVNSDSAGEMWRQAGFSVLSVPQGGFLHLASDGNTLRIERSP